MELLVPLARSLLQPIDSLAQAADFGLLTRQRETLRLRHVNFFVKITIEKGRLDIHRMDLPVFQGSESEEEVKRFKAGDRREGFIIVNTMSLSKPFCNKASTIATICFVLEDPFVTDNLAIRRKIDKIPRTNS